MIGAVRGILKMTCGGELATGKARITVMPRDGFSYSHVGERRRSG